MALRSMVVAGDAPGRTRCLALLGLARRAGRVEIGTTAVREAARRESLALIVVAADATANARRRIAPLLAGKRIPCVLLGSRDALGRALGRGPTVVAGVRDTTLARQIVDCLGEGLAASTASPTVQVDPQGQTARAGACGRTLEEVGR